MLYFAIFLTPAVLYALLYALYSLRMGRPLAALGALLTALIPAALTVLFFIR